MQRMFCKLLLPHCATKSQPVQTAHVFRALYSSKSKVPDKPMWDSINYDKLPKLPDTDLALVEQLERISLVEFNNEAGLVRLRDAVKLANQMHLVDTEGVEPLDTVLEDRECYLRRDEVTEGNCVDEVMSNASKVEEQYFVAPPGNIPMKKRDKDHLSRVLDSKADTDDVV
ncbi:glutamyl-tRNA(gln) amidotransferase subunit c, mitochondrial [Plakobranchus ocellatus]|uniref:Glutamyl-tRNA(Gln) amidotransferase subunit C, mitochondrial n=1 Tax=Plakobranchus ocellatus TaxID=259542 RepID=A0AAV4A4L4_9GAST|nr:glutamyl-tRNA(gln) amidotransferase subunit c, mitochondrial [Plakobranchus ocellatus]